MIDINTIPTKENIIGENSWFLEDKVAYFEQLLLSTGREGIDKVVEFLRSTDFYHAPASTVYHSNYRNGLLDHSLSVYALCMNYREGMIKMNPEMEQKLSKETIIISALLHDVCKTNFYHPVIKWKKGDSGQWNNYEGYKVVDMMPCGHGEKSVIMLQYLGLHLSVDEILAIRWHMGMFSDLGSAEMKYSLSDATNLSPMVSLLQISDYTSSYMFEKTVEN